MIDFLNAITYFLKDITVIVSLCCIMRFIFLDKLNIKKSTAVIFALFFAAVAFGGHIGLKSVEDYDSLLDFISNVLYIIVMRVFSTEKKLVRTIWIVMLDICTVDMFWSLISPITPDGLVSEYIGNIVLYAVVSILIFFAASKTDVNFLPKVFEEIPGWVYGVILFFEWTCYFKEFGISETIFDVAYAVSSVLVIISVLYLIIRVFYLLHQQNQILQELSLQKEYGEKMINGDEALRSFRHDYKNHLIVINSFLANGKTDDAREYISSINEDIGTALNKISTGNLVADALVNNKASVVAKDEISIKYNGIIPGEGIRNEDVSTVLSNLLDNAIEASRNVQGERVIRIKAGVANEHFMLSITNPSVNSSPASDGKLKTTKQDKKNHGIGLKNVTRTVKKYYGDFRTESADGIFTADVRMKLKSE